MSFSKSKVKRFNDISTDACAPPVGTYDPKLPESSQTSGQFSVVPVERLKDFADGSFSTSSVMTRYQVSESGSRKNLGQLIKSNSFKHSPTGLLRYQGNAKIQQYEQEIKQLLMERSALLKQLTSKDEEGKKVYSRMQAAIRERNFFQASVASFEKENKELRRVNEIYKIKFETFEETYKKKDVNMELANLRVHLASKNHQISDLRMEIVCTREEQELSIMKLCDKYKDISKISSLMIDAMEILKGEISRVKDHIAKMQITEECAEEFYECISAQLLNLDEKMVHYQSSVHDIIQEKEMSDFNCNLQNRDMPKKLPKTKITSDNLSDDLSSSRGDDQDCQRHDMERVMSSTLDSEHQKLPTAESYFEYLEKCRTEVKNDLKQEELYHHLDKELSHHGLGTLPKSEAQLMATVVTDLGLELQLVKDECEKLKLELELCKESCISLQASLEKQVTKAQETYELKTNEIFELNQTINALSTQLASVNDVLKEEKEKTNSQILFSKEKSKLISNLEDMLQTAKLRETALEDELTTQISKLNSFQEEMSGKLQASEEVLIILKNDINSRETKVNSLMQRESLLLRQIDLLTEKGNVSEQLVQKLTQKSVDLMDAMKAQQSLLHNTKDVLTSCEIDLDENKAKIKEYESLIGELNDNLSIQTRQREDAAKELAVQNELVSMLRSEYEISQEVNVQLKEERNLLTHELQNMSHKLISVKEELAAEIAKCDRLTEALNKKEDDARKLMEKLQEAMQANNQDLVENLEVEKLRKELLSWKNQCDELQAKIAPFQEQLDSYAIDRQMLMSKNMETMSDLKALSLQYATSLGHQNRKQKIHYMFNLKEENFNLKEENGKLWADILKLRNSLKRDGPKTPTTLGRIGSSSMPRSMHMPVNKENKDSGTNTPLRDCSNSDN